MEVVVPTTVSCDCCAPLHFTCEPPEGSEAGRKPEPLRVKVKSGLPTTLVLGAMFVSTGIGFGGGLMMKAMGLERPFWPAPDAGFKVIMVATPGLVTKAAGTVAVTMLPKAAPLLSTGTVVARGLPFHCTTVFRTKP